MDADCLIKITRAGYREPTLAAWEVSVPEAVRREVVTSRTRAAEAGVVEKNLADGRLAVVAGSIEDNGDDALIEAFNTGGFGFVATDDRRLIRRLTALGIRCVVPGLLLYQLVGAGSVSRQEGAAILERLAGWISSEELQIVRFLMRGGQ